jgi:hypothetical protein
VTLKPFLRTLGRSLRVQVLLFEAGFCRRFGFPCALDRKSTVTGRAVARGAARSKRSSIVLGTRIPGFGIGPQRFRQFIPTHRGGIKKLLQKIQGSGVDAQPFLPGRGF